MTKDDKIAETYGGQLFSHGNSKLPTQTMIFNMGPASNGKGGNEFRMLCPGYLKGLCQLCDPKADCYTVKAERQYKAVRNMRLRQGTFWVRSDNAEFIDAFNLHKTKNTKALRFNEAGEIENMAEAVKVCQIAARLNVTVYIYTTREDLWPILKSMAPNNLVVNGSGWMAHNEYRAVPKADIPKVYNELRAQGKRVAVCGGDCTRCTICLKRLGCTVLSQIER